MPPKVRITKAEIVTVTLDLLRREGEDAMNARSIASALGCSTQPVFSNFASMDELQYAVLNAAYEFYHGFLMREVASGTYPPYKAYGMAYIRFAREEKALFRALFMCDRKGREMIPTNDFSESVDMIMQANGISHEQAELWHMEMWSCVHGIGTMLATSFLDLDEDLISRMISDVYQGLIVRHAATQ
jgi:AcrR family transcriptional regulator